MQTDSTRVPCAPVLNLVLLLVDLNLVLILATSIRTKYTAVDLDLGTWMESWVRTWVRNILYRSTKFSTAVPRYSCTSLSERYERGTAVDLLVGGVRLLHVRGNWDLECS